MKPEIGIVMDPIGSIKIAKDSSFAMLLAAQARGWTSYYMTLDDLSLRGNRAWGRMLTLEVRDDPAGWYRFTGTASRPLDELDLILMRKDPPLDTEFLYATLILDQARFGHAGPGALVVNAPQALRDANEKLFALAFPNCCPPSLVTRSPAELRAFLAEQGDLILKPLGGMGGFSIFRVRPGDPNLGVILETLTAHATRYCLAQRFIPEIAAGDKRILMVDGEPVPYALARIPQPGESRGNLAAGGRGEGRPLGDRDREIAAQVGPELVRRGIYFAGLDVIGDWLTEINVTSPTCIRELDAQFGLDIASDLLDRLEDRLEESRLVKNPKRHEGSLQTSAKERFFREFHANCHERPPHTPSDERLRHDAVADGRVFHANERSDEPREPRPDHRLDDQPENPQDDRLDDRLADRFADGLGDQPAGDGS